MISEAKIKQIENEKSEDELLTFSNVVEPIYIQTNLHNKIFYATQIHVLLYDNFNRIAEELAFRGNLSIYEWFAVENVMSSSLWSISQYSENLVFHFGYDSSGQFQMEIYKNLSSKICERKYFLKLICNQQFPCADFKWYSNRSDIPETPCVVLYSDDVSPKLAINLKWANYIGFYRKYWQGRTMYPQFRFNRLFSDFNMTDFFFGKVEKDNKDANNFRAKDFEHQIENACEVRVYYDDIPEARFIFRATEHFLNSTFIFGHLLPQNDSFEQWDYVDIRTMPLEHILTYKSGAGVDFHSYFSDGELVPVTKTGNIQSEMVFRHYNFRYFFSLSGYDKSHHIIIYLYNNETNPKVAQKIALQPVNNPNNSLMWFETNALLLTSSWDLNLASRTVMTESESNR